MLEAYIRIALADPMMVLSVSDSIEELLGFSPHDILGGKVSLQSRIHVHDQDIADVLFSNGTNPAAGTFNIRLRQADRRIRCCRGYYTKEQAAPGANVILELQLQDAKSLSNELGQQPLMVNFKAMMENTDDYIYFKDRNHVFTGASQTLVAITSPTEHWTDLIGKTDYDVFPEEYADIYYRLEKQVFANLPVARELQQTLDKAGNKGWVDNRKYPIRNESGEIIGLFGIARDVTENINNQHKIERLLDEQRVILENRMIAIATVRDRKIVWANRAFETLLGYDKHELLGEPSRKLYAREDEYQAIGIAYQSIGVDGVLRNQCEFVCKDGRHIWVDMSGSVLRKGSGESLWVIIDATQRKEYEDSLRIAATAFEVQEGILITDANCVILKVNRAFTRITGYTAEEAIGNTPKLLKSGRQDASFYAAMWDSIRQTGSWEGEIWNRRKEGEIYPEFLTIAAVKDHLGKVTNYVATLTDITLNKAAEDEIKNLAFYDPLTRLPNRRLLHDRLRQVLAASARRGNEGALLFIDLDNFKTLNDTLGHNIGDLLLQEVAQRLLACVREGDTVARLGGDEFVVMLEDLSKDVAEAAAQTKAVGEKILAALNHPYFLNGHEYRNTPSIGAALFKDAQGSIDELLKKADIAMYQAKKAGRNSLRFVDA